jgi:hypothetical protein
MLREWQEFGPYSGFIGSVHGEAYPPGGFAELISIQDQLQ